MIQIAHDLETHTAGVKSVESKLPLNLAEGVGRLRSME